MKRIIATIFFVTITCASMLSAPTQVVLKETGSQGHDQAQYPLPEVTLDVENLTLSIYFGMAAYLTIICQESNGTMCELVEHKYFASSTSTIISSLNPGFYEIEIHCTYGTCYSANFAI